MKTQEQFKENPDQCPCCHSYDTIETDYCVTFDEAFLKEQCTNCNAEYFIKFELLEYRVVTPPDVKEEIENLEARLELLKSI